MNQLELKSLDANVTAFCKKLTNAQLVEVTDFVVYHSTDTSIKATKLSTEFVNEFFGEKDWNDNLSDELKKPEFFTKASRNTQEVIRLVRVGLLQECFFRLAKKTKEPSEDKLSAQDKKTLKEIINEHHAMLEYQLEDEDGVRKVGGDELVAEKNRHKEFLEKFGKSKNFAYLCTQPK